MSKKITEILPYEEWVSKLLAEPAQCNHNHQICYWNVSGRFMFREDTFFPHFGKVFAAALDPLNHKAEVKSSYSMYYFDKTGNTLDLKDDETYEWNGNKVEETFEGLIEVDCNYYTAGLVFKDWDCACKCAYEMYVRRRRNGIEEEE